MPLFPWFLAALAGYLIGALPFGLIVGRAWKGIDLRAHGSGNLGATNALRVLGKPLGVVVLLLDAGKGLLPVLLFPWLLDALGWPAPPWLATAVAGLAVVGHVFPIYLGFKGGKGVATSAGAFGALHPVAFAVALATFLVTVAASRFVSLGSLLAAVALPTAAIALDGPELAFGAELPRTVLFGVMGALVIVRHRANVGRLLKGTENKLGQGKSAAEREPEPEHPVAS